MDMGISKEEKATSIHVILRDEAKDIDYGFLCFVFTAR